MKKSIPADGPEFLCSLLAYTGLIASVGQTSAQAPQSMHLSGSIL
jgi:hypothetical protein